MSSAKIAFAGNPNCGKTSLFNALTGDHQKVGNWAGVTVDRKEGHFRHRDMEVTLIDLPGTYSLSNAHASSLDESIARDYLLSHSADLVVNILDASNLERNLYLTSQFLEMRIPLIVVLTMVDRAQGHLLEINYQQLSDELGVPVIPIKHGDAASLDLLKDTLYELSKTKSKSAIQLPYATPLPASLSRLKDVFTATAAGAQVDPHWLAIEALAGDSKALSFLTPADFEALQIEQSAILKSTGEDADLLIADSRYDFANHITLQVTTYKDRISKNWTERLDQIILNRFLGLPIFLGIMYLMFLFTINLSGAFIDFFDQAMGALLVDGPSYWLDQWGAPAWLIAVGPKGVGVGIQTVSTFIPVIGFLFLFLTLLEESGYMARAAFVMDRAMRTIGLPGKSFVPMLLGFGCTVPAIMATRTLEKRQERLVTSLMAPFMSCGARLPVYALFAAAFFPNNGQNLVFGLYLIGLCFAIFTGLVLKACFFSGKADPFLMELPPYHKPSLILAIQRSGEKLKHFILEAGQVIVVVILALSLLSSIGTDGSFGNEESENSVLATIGKSLTPIVEPLGLSEENWPATVGLFTGIFAKEAVVGTLNSLYGQLGAEEQAQGDISADQDEVFDLLSSLTDAAATIPANLLDLTTSLTDPLGIDIGDISNHTIAAEEQEVDVPTFGAMVTRFDGQLGAFAYLLMILLYTPCVAAIGAISREIGGHWASFAVVWTTGLAYGSAVLVYQLGTFSQHQASSSIWIACILGFLAVAIGSLYQFGRRSRSSQIPVQEMPL